MYSLGKSRLSFEKVTSSMVGGMFLEFQVFFLLSWAFVSYVNLVLFVFLEIYFWGMSMLSMKLHSPIFQSFSSDPSIYFVLVEHVEGS